MSDTEKKRLWPETYEVGYGKPPASGRFVKGKSGNPHGRPKKKSASKPAIDETTRDRQLKEADRTITLLEGGHPIEMKAGDAVMRAEVVAALKGNAQAQKHFLDRTARYREELKVEIEENHEYWKDYAAKYEKIAADLQKKGEPFPKDLPHPEDLIFKEGSHVMIRGGDPINSAPAREWLIRLRDVLLLQAEKDRRSVSAAGGSPIYFISGYLAWGNNLALPKRMQLDDFHLTMRVLSHRTLKKRDLDKQLKTGWSVLGVHSVVTIFSRPVLPFLVERGLLSPAAAESLSATVNQRYKARDQRKE